MSTTIGRQGETLAAESLSRQGYEILDRNWRTRWCEIDIVARRGDTVYFVEVKYRRRSNWGSGLDYITPRKIRQMRFAAEFWLTKHPGSADNFRLAAMQLS